MIKPEDVWQRAFSEYCPIPSNYEPGITATIWKLVQAICEEINQELYSLKEGNKNEQKTL